MKSEQWHTRIVIEKKKKYQADITLKTLKISGHLIFAISTPLYFGFKKIFLYRILFNN